MKTNYTQSSRRAFTLVELLVVIAIIAVLASLGFAGFRAARETAKKTSAKNHLVGLVQAVDAYYDDYSKLPVKSGSGSGDDDFTTDTSKSSNLMKILIGIDKAENPKGTSFVNISRSKSEGREGLDRDVTSAALYDPWSTKSSPQYYEVILDTNYDNEIKPPQDMMRTGEENKLYGVRAAIWTYGADKKPGGNDDVKSWE